MVVAGIAIMTIMTGKNLIRDNVLARLVIVIMPFFPFDFGASSNGSFTEALTMVFLIFFLFVARLARFLLTELGPYLRELIFHIEESPSVIGYMSLRSLIANLPESGSAFASSEVYMHYEVG